MTVRVGINGLGRIGRCIIRALIEHNMWDVKIVAANATAQAFEYVNLLKYDSSHGRFNADLSADGAYLKINDNKIKIFNNKNPDEIPWHECDVDVVLECTGQFKNKKQIMGHIKAGVKRAIVSCPIDDADSTIVYGVNNHALKAEHKVISAGSCTTNALAPIIEILHKNFTIESGDMTTIHAYTNDQNLLDNRHKDPRRARACGVSMIPTSTGAAKSIGLIIPELSGKLSGSAIRVPVVNVSLIDLVCNLRQPTSVDEVNQVMQEAAKGQYKNIIEIAPTQLVSVDFNHNMHSSIFDPFETRMHGEKFLRILSWYDNEWAFACRMLDLANISRK